MMSTADGRPRDCDGSISGMTAWLDVAGGAVAATCLVLPVPVPVPVHCSQLVLVLPLPLPLPLTVPG